MAWVRLDDGFAEHHKIAGLGDRAFRLHVAALCYCARNLTDGQLDARAVKVVCAIVGNRTKSALNELENARLWNKNSDGYTIKDFTEYNPSAEHVKTERTKAAERMRRLRSGRTTSERSPERSGEVTAHVRGPRPLPKELQQQQTEAKDPEHPAADDDGKPPAEADSWHTLAADLQAIGWAPWQTAKAEHDQQRAQAALNRATAEANDNPGGYAWTLFNNGGTITPPEPPTPKRKTPDELLDAAAALPDLEAGLDYLAGIPWLTTSQRDHLAAQLEQRLNTAATSEAA